LFKISEKYINSILFFGVQLEVDAGDDPGIFYWIIFGDYFKKETLGCPKSSSQSID
jgi:hypothetical protein